MVYYRKLFPADGAKIEAHLLGLSQEDRARRFHASVSDDVVRAYCRHIDWSNCAIVGGFVHDRLVGIAEGMQIAADRTEIAVSVEGPYQHHGVGRELVRRVLTCAANRGVSLVELVYVRGDPSIPHIAASLGGHVDVFHAIAEITPPAHDPANETEEFVEDIAAVASWAVDAAFWPLRLVIGQV